MDDRWLYVGKLWGNKLTGVVVFDFFNNPVYDDSSQPVDSMSTDFLNLAGVFVFTLD